MGCQRLHRLRRKWVSLWRTVISADYRLLRGAGIFDADFYARQLGLDEPPADPIWHYLRTPLPNYDRNRIRELLEHPFADPHPLFDTRFYLARYLPDGTGVNPLIDYLRRGWKQGCWPGPYLDPETYAAESGWHPGCGHPLGHYAEHGADSGCSTSGYFDVDWYLDNWPALESIRSKLIRNYRLFGAAEGKSPVPVFDPGWYRRNYVKKPKRCEDYLAHYLATADFSDNRPNRWFDPDYYRAQIADSGLSRSEALGHYLTQGIEQQRWQNLEIGRLEEKPVISVLVPVYRPDPYFLKRCIRSVYYQTYPHWELCLADDCSGDRQTETILNQWAAADQRIKLTLLPENRGIAAATNGAASLATGDYLGFLDNDDELTPDCLFEIAAAINDSKPELIYTDEDLIGIDQVRHGLFRKPDFNLELLLSHNYITHFSVISADLFAQLGGLNPACDGAQDYDLVLRASERAGRIAHIPRVLYHWRALESSTSVNHSQKTYANEAGRLALEQSLQRRGLAAGAELTELNFYYHPVYELSTTPGVTVLMWLGEPGPDSLARMGRLLAMTDYPRVRLKAVYCSSPEFDRLLEGTDPQSIPENLEFLGTSLPSKYPALKEAAQEIRDDFLVFLDQDVQEVNRRWVEELAGICHHGEIGLVSGRTLIDGRDGRSYTVPDLTSDDPRYVQEFLCRSSVHLNGAHCLQQCRCCGGEMVIIRREFYEHLGGLDAQRFPWLLALSDLSLRALEHGMRNVYTPKARADLAGQAGSRLTPVPGPVQLQGELEAFRSRWSEILARPDPFYNRGVLVDNGLDQGDFVAWLQGEKNAGAQAGTAVTRAK